MSEGNENMTSEAKKKIPGNECKPELFCSEKLIEAQNINQIQPVIKINPSSIEEEDKTLCSRYELKYRITESQARSIANYIQSRMEMDKYSRKSPDGNYCISSLYIDSNLLDLCKDTVEKKKSRYKLRVRCYDDNPESPCFVEIKRRIDGVIHKSRVRTGKNQLDAIFNGSRISGLNSEKDTKNMEQFQYYLRMIHARPILLCRYLRQAFEDISNSDSRLRITFDRKIAFKPVDRPIVTTGGAGWRDLAIDFVVMEIKFTDKYPVWVNDMIKMFDIKRGSMSKYVSSIKQSATMGFSSQMNMARMLFRK